MLLGQEIWWQGYLNGQPLELYSRVRFKDTSFYFLTPSNARIHFGMSSHKILDDALEGQYVDIVVSSTNVTDAELEQIRVLAQANDTRQVVVRRKRKRTQTQADSRQQ